jgi:chromosome segregation ATPase
MFNSKSITSVDLSKKVDNVLNAFKTAIDGLKEVNASAELEIAARDEEIKAAQAEKEALENIRKKNEGVLAKLNAILE